MNAVTTKKAERLTETEVHAAIEAMKESGEKPTALGLLKTLGRGSLTTITRYMNTFERLNAAEQESQGPALLHIPADLGNAGEQLMKRIWIEAVKLANQEIDVQKKALAEAEAQTTAKIAEAMEFSDMQTKRIEELEESNEQLESKIESLREWNESIGKENAGNSAGLGLVKADNDRLKKENEALKKSIADLHAELIKKSEQRQEEVVTSEKEKNSLNLQIQSQQVSLEGQSQTINELKKELAETRKDCKKAEEKAAELQGMLKAGEKETKELKKN